MLVTGADGRIGRALTEQLLQSGFAVTALSRIWSAPSPADRVLAGDAGDESLVADALSGVAAVAHLAAIPHPSIDTPRAVFVGNTAATFTVLDQAGEAGLERAVIASSINAFGVPMNHHDVAPAYYPLDEQSPVAHDDAYSLSKWVDEQSARWAHSRYGIDVVALRLPLVRDLDTVRVFAAEAERDPSEFARLSREGWAYLDLADAVDAFLRALTAPLSGAHTLLVAASDTLSREGTEDLLDRYAPSVPRLRRFEGGEGLVDTSNARRVLGWSPAGSIHEPAAVSAGETA
ncbi:hypothetical protein ASF46_13090 [Rathayibacter sp. Leaf296]|nr:hypothetical protein ASF46_13090 [Rathayibacter sp. Leaf296]